MHDSGWRWIVNKFATRPHFMRGIATLILGIAAYQSIKLGKVDDTWMVLVGMVIGYYFKGGECRDQDHANKPPG